MPPSDPDDPRTPAPRGPTIAERLAADAAATAVKAGVARTVEKAADSALDAVERLLFGKVGGAEEALRTERIADPLERLRAQYGAPTAEPQAATPAPVEPVEPVEPPEQRARRQLEELKRRRAEQASADPADSSADAGPAPVKRTL